MRIKGWIVVLVVGCVAIVAAVTWKLQPLQIPVPPSLTTAAAEPREGVVSPLCGSNAVLLCRGGPDQGEPCASDGDCAGGICTRMGHPRRCRIEVFCNVSKDVRCSDDLDCPLYPLENPDDWCPYPVVASADCQTHADCGAGGECINGIAQCEYEAPRVSWGQPGDLVGDWVIGRCSLEDGTYNAPTASSFAHAVSISFDPTPPRRLYVSDYFRVLAFEGDAIEKSTSDASIVIGQATFDRHVDHSGHRLPGDLTVGGFNSQGPRTLGRSWDRGVRAVATPDMQALWVTDVKRVARYSGKPATNAAMDLVLGNVDFDGTIPAEVERRIEHATRIDALPRCVGGRHIGAACTRDADCPESECATTLAVADCGFHRVAVWRRPPQENGQRADVCIGQPDCAGTARNRGALPSADSLSCPRGVAFDSKGNLWVLDAFNHRVLRFEAGFTQEKHEATLVFGQPSFDRGEPGHGAQALRIGEGPAAGIDVDNKDNLAIADIGNGRVLFVPPPYEKATRVIGPPDFSTTGYGRTTDGSRCDVLAGARDLAFDDADNLWVADSNNGRALRFAADFPPTGAAADVMQGQISCGVYHWLHVSATSFGHGHGHGAAIVREGPHAGLGCFGDSQDNRILCWRDVVAARTGMPPANLVLGQRSFDTFLPNRPQLDATTLQHPTLMDFISGDVPRLVVADRLNNRVLGYRLDGLQSGAAADLVLGQRGAFDVSGCPAVGAVDAQTLCEPTSARGDSEDNIWVADHRTGRVLLFCFGAPGSASGVCTRDNRGDAVADLVLGKPDMTTAFDDAFCTSPTASSLCRPYDVASDPERSRVIVTDQGLPAQGARILVYEYPLSSSMDASTVIGIPSGRFDTYAPSRRGACWGGPADGRPCDYVEPYGARPGSGAKTCVGGALDGLPCTDGVDCPKGTCGCPSPGACDYARTLQSVTAVDAVAIHPTRDVVYVGKGPHVLEYRGPLKSGMKAERIGGFTTPHRFNAGSTGYTECQWDRLEGGLAFDAEGNLYAPQGGAEHFTAVLIVADPTAAAQ